MLKSESISVIIPVYNAEDFVGEAIESVLKQTVKPLEVILVNDGSTDASVEEIKTYIPDVKLINQENKGIGGARNTGIKNAKGELFSFLDSDDLWTEDHLEILLSAIQQDENISIVSGYVEQFLNEKNEELSNRIPKGQEVMAGYVAGASLIKKEVFDKVGLFDDTLTLAEYIDWFATHSINSLT